MLRVLGATCHFQGGGKVARWGSRAAGVVSAAFAAFADRARRRRPREVPLVLPGAVTRICQIFHSQ